MLQARLKDKTFELEPHANSNRLSQTLVDTLVEWIISSDLQLMPLKQRTSFLEQTCLFAIFAATNIRYSAPFIVFRRL